MVHKMDNLLVMGHKNDPNSLELEVDDKRYVAARIVLPIMQYEIDLDLRASLGLSGKDDRMLLDVTRTAKDGTWGLNSPVFDEIRYSVLNVREVTEKDIERIRRATKALEKTFAGIFQSHATLKVSDQEAYPKCPIMFTGQGSARAFAIMPRAEG